MKNEFYLSIIYHTTNDLINYLLSDAQPRRVARSIALFPGARNEAVSSDKLTM